MSPSSDGLAPAASNRSDRAVVLVLVAIGCLFASQTMIVALVPLTASYLGLSGVEIGVLVALPGLIALACDIPIAVASDSVGRRRLLIAGGSLGGLAALLFAVDGGRGALLLATVGLGFYLSLTLGTTLAYMTEVGDPTRQPVIQGSNGAVQAIASLVGVVALGVAFDLGGPRLGAATIGMFAVAVVIAAALGRETKRVRRRPGLPDLLRGYRRAIDLLASRPGLRVSSALTLVQTSHFVIIGAAFVPLLIVRGLGATAGVAGFALAVRNVFIALTSSMFAYSLRRFGIVRPMIAGGALAAGAVVLLPFALVGLVPFVLLAIQGIGIGLAPATSNTLVARSTSDQERALGFAAQSVPARANSFLLPLLLGTTLQIADLRAVFVVAGIATAGFIVLVVVLMRPVPRRDAGSGP